jgi:N-acetylglucosamine-6-phosphate deacetylase
LWPQLADDRVTASLLADLEHLPAPMLKSLVRGKGPGRIILASDSVHIAGLPPGRYSLTGHPVELTPGGRIRLSGTDLLAGSALMLLQGVVNVAQVTDLSLAEALACATTTPAAFFGLDAPFGPPRPGQAANLMVFEIDRSGARWQGKVRGYFRL